MDIIRTIEDLNKLLSKFSVEDAKTLAATLDETMISIGYYTRKEAASFLKTLINIFNKIENDPDKIELLTSVLTEPQNAYTDEKIVDIIKVILNLLYMRENEAKQHYDLIEQNESFKKFLLDNKFISKYTLTKFKKIENQANNPRYKIKKLLRKLVYFNYTEDQNPLIISATAKKIQEELKKIKKINASHFTQLQFTDLQMLSVFFNTETKIKIFESTYQRCFAKSNRESNFSQLKTLLTSYHSMNLFIWICKTIERSNIQPDTKFYDQVESSITRNPDYFFAIVPYLMIIASRTDTKLPDKLLPYKNIVKSQIVNIYTDFFKYKLSKLPMPSTIEEWIKLSAIENPENETQYTLKYLAKILLNF